MEFHQLQYVVEVAKHRHFSRAAEEICVSQSSLSQQITKLEDELGIKLFDRTTRTVIPTSAGAEFLDYARQVLDGVSAARQCAQAHIGLAKGKVIIGAITTLESINFVAMITAFHNAYPGLYLDINTAGSYQLTQMLHDGEVNVAILTPPAGLPHDDIDLYPLADDEFVLITPAAHPLAAHATIDLSAAAGENFIFPSRDQSIHTIYLNACRDAGFNPCIVCQSSHSETSLALVSDGLGVSLFPLDTIKKANPPGIAIVRLDNPIHKHIAMVLAKRPYYPPPVIAFRDFVLKWRQAGFGAMPPAPTR